LCICTEPPSSRRCGTVRNDSVKHYRDQRPANQDGNWCARSERQSVAEPFGRPVPGDAFLLEPDTLAETVGDEVLVGGLLLIGQAAELRCGRAGLGHPAVAVGEERFAIHEQASGLRQPRAQLIEDGEAVRVEVAPLQDVCDGEPG
jgi:hypothetical protein